MAITKPGHPYLSLAQLYDAISFYYDHQGEVEADIEANTLAEQELKQRQAN